MARYWDTKTGHFASKATWKRSRAHGGTRFKRTRTVSKARKAVRRGPKPTTTRKGRVRPAPLPVGTFPQVGIIPAEFLVAEDDYFEAGYESEEEEEYP